MKNRILIIILAVLSFLLIILGLYGYILNKNNDNNDDKKTYNIKFTYFLDDVKIDKIPENNGEYIFNKYICDNDINGSFDNENWGFISNSNKSGSCELYFNKSKYEITLSVVNAIEDNNNIKSIDREKDAIFKISPNEGYKYKEAICSGNKVGTWNDTDNTFTISSIVSDVMCTIKFEKKEYTIEIKVNNGNGSSIEKAYYGDNKAFVIEPSSGYGNPTIECSNEQIPTFENNNLKFEKITNNTMCTIQFNKVISNTYNFEIKNPSEYNTINITSGNTNIIGIEEGKDLSIILQSIDVNVKPNLICNDSQGNSIVPTIENQNDLNTIRTFKFIGIKSNISCSISKE